MNRILLAVLLAVGTVGAFAQTQEIRRGSAAGGGGGGVSAPVGTVVNTNTAVTNALLAVGAKRTNVVPATVAMITNILGFAPQPLASTLTQLSTNTTSGTGTVVLSSVTDGKQPLASTLTALSTNTTTGTGTVVLSSVTDGKQDALGFVPQTGSANLTNWSGLSTNVLSNYQPAGSYQPAGDYQPASANLTNWSAITADSAGIQSTLGQVYQATNSNLTLLSGYGPGTWQATNANLTLLSGYGPGTWQATNANLTTLATLNGSALTNIAASNVVSGGQLPMGTLSADSVTTGGIYYAKDANSRGISSGVTIGAATNLTASTLYASQSFRQYEGAALTHAGTVTVDFDAANPKTSLTLTGNVTFAFSNVGTNKTYILRVFNNQATNCTLTFPTGSSTNFLGGAPTYVTTGKYARWIMSCVGTGDTNVLSAWAEN